MKEITLKVPDKKLGFFMELVKHLGIEVTKEDIVIPEWQKEQVRKSKQEIVEGTAELIEWETTKKDLFKKYNVK